MDPKDDPEAHIRELERSLSERAWELGTGPETGSVGPPPTQPWTYGNFPPPPPGPPAPWPGYADQYPAPAQPKSGSGARLLIVLGAVVAFLVAGGVAAFVMFAGSGTTTGGKATSSSPTTSRTKITGTASPIPPPVQAPSETTTVTAPGETVIVSGIEENRTIACDGNAVIVSGVSNVLEITGHCANLTVSGVKNSITVETADAISVSGFENHITYRSGEPEISKSGLDNVVEQG